MLKKHHSFLYWWRVEEGTTDGVRRGKGEIDWEWKRNKGVGGVAAAAQQHRRVAKGAILP